MCVRGLKTHFNWRKYFALVHRFQPSLCPLGFLSRTLATETDSHSVFNSEIVFSLISCGESIPAVFKDGRERCQQYSQRTFVSVWNKFFSESSAMAVCFYQRVTTNPEASAPQLERNVSRVTLFISGSRQKHFSPVFSVRGGKIPVFVCPQKSSSFLMTDFFFSFSELSA